MGAREHILVVGHMRMVGHMWVLGHMRLGHEGGGVVAGGGMLVCV